MANSNIQGWKDVRADFGDSSRMFNAAQQGISNAGTVFGKLRESIIAEEQKAIDNAYKEKAFNENVRQFGLTSALEKDKFGETKRSNLVKEEDSDLDRIQKDRATDLSYRSAMAGVTAQNRSIALREKEYNDNQLIRNNMKQVYQDMSTNSDNLIKEKEILNQRIDSSTNDNEKAELSNRLNTIDRVIDFRNNAKSATDFSTFAKNEIGLRTGNVTPTTYDEAARVEQDRGAALLKAQKEQLQHQDKSTIDATKLIQSNNLVNSDQATLSKALGVAKSLYPDLPDDTIMNTFLRSGTYNAWFDWSGKNALEDTSTINEFIENPAYAKNPIGQELAAKALLRQRNSNK